MVASLCRAVMVLLPAGLLGAPRLPDWAQGGHRSLNTVGPADQATGILLRPEEPCGDKLYFLVLVHSAPERLAERALIRETWGSVRALQGWQVRVVFLVGRAAGARGRDPGGGMGPSLKSRSLHSEAFQQAGRRRRPGQAGADWDRLVALEAGLHGDMLQGNFTDGAATESVKAVLGYRWVTERCTSPRFVLKTNDDVFVEMYHLFNFVSAVYGFAPAPSLVCDVIPAGTRPHRGARPSRHRALRSLPKYCSGAAYLITPTLVSRFLKATGEVPELTRSDAYMTGLVRARLGVSPFYLNLRYSYQPERARKWLGTRSRTPLPFIFVVSQGDSGWPSLVRALWQKSVAIQADYPV